MKSISKRTNSKTVVVKHIPSKFIGYDVKELSFRPLTLGELKYLNTKNLSEESLVQVYNDACINFDLLDLSYYDLNYVISYITLFTKPDQKWNWENKCDKCNQSIYTELKSSNFLDFADIKIKALPICATVNEIDYEFGLNTVQNNFDYLNNDNEEYENNILAMALIVKNMTLEEAYKNLNAIDDREEMEFLEHIEKLLVHGKPTKKVLCNNLVKDNEGNDTKETCGHTNTFEMESLEVAHLKPFRINEKSFDSRIVFGKRSK